MICNINPFETSLEKLAYRVRKVRVCYSTFVNIEIDMKETLLYVKKSRVEK